MASGDLDLRAMQGEDNERAKLEALRAELETFQTKLEALRAELETDRAEFVAKLQYAEEKGSLAKPEVDRAVAELEAALAELEAIRADPDAKAQAELVADRAKVKAELAEIFEVSEDPDPQREIPFWKRPGFWKVLAVVGAGVGAGAYAASRRLNGSADDNTSNDAPTWWHESECVPSGSSEAWADESDDGSWAPAWRGTDPWDPVEMFADAYDITDREYARDLFIDWLEKD